MNIVLTGLRGSGKTTLGKRLAQTLNWDFIDLDECIEQKAQMKISEMVQKYSWEYFRKQEEIATTEVCQCQNTVIGSGGGTVTFPNNAEILKENSFIVYLHRQPQDCLRLIGNDPNRPPLTNLKDQLQEMQTLYKERHPIYKTLANLEFQRTDDTAADTLLLSQKIRSKLSL